jgi:hypothetical protein
VDVGLFAATAAAAAAAAGLAYCRKRPQRLAREGGRRT